MQGKGGVSATKATEAQGKGGVSATKAVEAHKAEAVSHLVLCARRAAQARGGEGLVGDAAPVEALGAERSDLKGAQPEVIRAILMLRQRVAPQPEVIRAI